MGAGIVVCFRFCSAFVGGLELSGQRLVMRMNVSVDSGLIVVQRQRTGWFNFTFAEDDSSWKHLTKIL